MYRPSQKDAAHRCADSHETLELACLLILTEDAAHSSTDSHETLELACLLILTEGSSAQLY